MSCYLLVRSRSAPSLTWCGRDWAGEPSNGGAHAHDARWLATWHPPLGRASGTAIVRGTLLYESLETATIKMEADWAPGGSEGLWSLIWKSLRQFPLKIRTCNCGSVTALLCSLVTAFGSWHHAITVGLWFCALRWQRKSKSMETSTSGRARGWPQAEYTKPLPRYVSETARGCSCRTARRSSGFTLFASREPNR